jgi:hypothetical protein
MAQDHRAKLLAVVVTLGMTGCVDADSQRGGPRAGSTMVLGPFTGLHAPLHPDNLRPQPLEYDGTDLGWSYAHGGKLHFLFGDTTASQRGQPIDPMHDDAFGTIDLADWPDPARIAPGNLPLLKLAQRPGTAQAAALDPGVPMEGLKTPLGAFSTGAHEFAVFVTSKPVGCRVDADCSNGLSCDTGLGFFGGRFDRPGGLTFACRDGASGCSDDTMFDTAGKAVPGSGLCSDRTSTVWSDTDWGRYSATAMVQLIGMRSTEDPARYTAVRYWPTNKFINVAVRTAADFVPQRGAGRAHQDYRSAGASGANRRVFLWGRPWFVGVNAAGRTLGLYFAYVDLPLGADYTWHPHYYAGTDAAGIPQFSKAERDAVPVDLDASQAGVQPQEVHDIVQQMSVVWVERLGKWVMFYGGGISKVPVPQVAPSCGVLEIFVRAECPKVDLGNGAIRMRTADDPWGPWSPPQDLIVGGNPEQRPVADQFAPGGVLHHPACAGKLCETGALYRPAGEYGWLYGANIIEEWIRPAGAGVDVIWNASTWDPYRVVLLRTHIDPGSR